MCSCTTQSPSSKPNLIEKTDDHYKRLVIQLIDKIEPSVKGDDKKETARLLDEFHEANPSLVFICVLKQSGDWHLYFFSKEYMETMYCMPMVTGIPDRTCVLRENGFVCVYTPPNRYTYCRLVFNE